MNQQAELDFALSAVRAGAGMARRVQLQHAREALEKADQSPVTIADFAVQALIAAMLEQSFPEDPLVAEEDSGPLKDPSRPHVLEAVTRHVDSEFRNASSTQVCAWIDRGMGEIGDRFWTLDPVDGTKGFLRDGQYVVALALIEAGEVTPVIDRMYPLTEAIAAFRYLDQGRARGKVVITVEHGDKS